MGNIIIDAEFQQLIPPLREDEYNQLQASILDEGCRDALVLWQGKNILVDGHNRYQICSEHDIEYRTIERPFDSRAEVAEWMLRNQLGRRNLTDAARIQAARRYKAMLEAEARERMTQGINQHSPVQNSAQGSEPRTREKLGDLAGMSHYKYSQGEHVDDHAPAPVKAKWEAGDISTHRAYQLTKALEQSPDEYRERIAELAGDNDEKVRILNRLYKSMGSPETNGTFDEIMRTGGFAYGDEMDKRIDYTEAAVEDIQRGLNRLAKYHKLLARQARQATIEMASATSDFISPETATLEAYKQGDIVRVGGHILLCADNTSQEAMDLIASLPSPALAFCDPPYNADASDYDDGSFLWSQDYLCDVADVVAVTPGISSIWSFMRVTNMPYKWSTSTYIKNGMTRGALGFGNWMYTALFSVGDSIHKNRQDVYSITINGNQLSYGDKRQKPSEYLAWLFELLTEDGDWIIDAFGGSGNSVIVADGLGRNCLSIEKDVDVFKQMVANVKAYVSNEEAGVA